MVTALTVLAALAILGWGFYRARPYGKVGLLAWVQSVVLMGPWLVFLSLFTIGIPLNFAGLLLLFVLSTGLYIAIGRQLRTIAQTELSQTPTAQPAANSATGTDRSDRTPPAPSLTAALESISVPPEDLKQIQGIFGIDTFFVTETVPYQEGVILKGNLRGTAAVIYPQLAAQLKQRLDDRYRLFLVQNQEDRPVVVVLPSRNDPQPLTLTQKLLAGVLFVATIATSLEAGGIIRGFDFFAAPARFREVLPFALGLLTLLGVHELGHWLSARRYQVKLNLPFLIPTWQIGCFGGITRFASLLPDRTALFDIAIAGPAAGGILGFVFLVTGLFLSQSGGLFEVPTQFFEGSILVGTLARAILGTAVHEQTVAVHPLVVLGWVGLVITAINLMPAGQLDGGRIVQAIYGRQTANRTTIATTIVLAVASLVNPLAFYWAIVILVLQRNLERPSLNELTEPDDTRAALGLLALFLMVIVLLPLTPSLAGRLGIGG